MNKIGTIVKMRTEWGKVVDYYLPVGNSEIFLNELIGRKIYLRYLNEIHCLGCGKKIKKSYAQGWCYDCFQTRPETAPCILRPELCQAHRGISRDIAWARKHCLQDHYVYLAISSGLKVGVTRKSQIPTRWIDQGAARAIKLAKTPNRHLAGVIEVALKDHLNDKTNWRKMLQNEAPSGIDLLKENQKARLLLGEEFKTYFVDDDEITEIVYPITKYPQKVKSIGFDKEEIITGKLKGIKGQYLIFEDDRVLNIRKHGGYLIELESPSKLN